MDDVLERLVDDAGPVVRRIDAVHAVAPFRVAPDLVLRELVSLAAAHSKSTFPAALLADCPGLRRSMRDVLLTDLEEHRRAGPTATPDDTPAREPGANARWYPDPVRDAYAWLDSPDAAHRALVDDAIDAVRLVRAADALRQRGTTLRTAAGYEIFIDAESGSAVFALRTAGNDHLLLLRADSPLSAGEANLRSALVTPHGDLRIAFHRGRFSSRGAEGAACDATARVVADIGADVLGAFACRRPSSDLPEPSRVADDMRIELERPADEPSFADAVAGALARRDLSLGLRVAVVADLEGAAPAERARYHRGTAVPADGEEAIGILRALDGRGMKVSSIDRHRAFEDVRRVRLDGGEVLVEARDVAGVRVPRDRPGAESAAPRWVRARRRARVAARRHHGGRAPRRAQQHRRGRRTARGADDPRRALRPRVVPSVRGARAPRPARPDRRRVTASLGLVERVAALHRVDLFAEVPGRALSAVAEAAAEVRAPPGAVLIAEGAVEAHLYAVVEGRVRVHRGDQTLVELGPGATVGELAVLVPQPRAASVTTLEPTLVLRVDKAVLDDLLADWPELTEGVIAALVARLRAAADHAARGP